MFTDEETGGLFEKRFVATEDHDVLFRNIRPLRRAVAIFLTERRLEVVVPIGMPPQYS